MSYTYTLWKKCPICHGKVLHPFSSENGNNLLICRNCRHIFFHRIPSSAELQKYYAIEYTNSHSQRSIQSDNIKYYESHLQEIHTYANRSPEMSILDYGCSYPLFLEVAKRAGAKVLGCDYSADAAAYGKKVGVLVVSPEALSALDQRFDVIRFSHALEHLVDPLKTMQAMRRLLKPDGIFYITQPSFPVFNCTDFSSRLKDAVYPSHLHFFSPLSVVELANQSRLKVVKLFTHQNETNSFNDYGKFVDYVKSVTGLIQIASSGDKYFGFLNNYPFFMGENIVAVMSIDPKRNSFIQRVFENF
jgi:SAM-dependent methyltransferase